MHNNNLELGYALFEDEHLTTQYIKNTVSTLRPGYKMVAHTSSVGGIENIIKNSNPDFIISGLRLSDGLTVDELNRLQCQLPTIIFTGYSNYLPLTHGLNVVHTALKPVPAEKVELSLQKMENVLLSMKQPGVET